MRRAGVVAAVLVAGAVRGALAASVTLVPSTPPATYHPAGRAVDVAGIAPGMSVDAVRAALAARFADVQVQEGNLGLEDNGVVVGTQNYVVQMTAQRDAEQMTVWFGTPTTGNAVVEAQRQVTYFDAAAAPTLTAVRAELVGRYGTPVYDGPAVGTGEVLVMVWTYKGDKPSDCVRGACRADTADGLDMKDVGTYRRAVRSGHELSILALMLTGIADPTRAASVVVTVNDAATKLKSLDAAVAQMRAAAHPGAAGKPVAGRPGRVPRAPASGPSPP